jgi:hypothetical protein
MNRSTYRPISNFGSNAKSQVNNPLTYCMTTKLDQQFMHGGSADIFGAYSKNCQQYMGQYCAEKWDEFCEIASNDPNTNYPNNIQQCGSIGDTACKGMNAGEILIRNTAAKKYLTSMANCVKKQEPFDPNVASSPMISYWISDGCSYSNACIPVYEVDPSKIDSDIVMNKILNKPIIAIEILINIYNTMKRKGTLQQLKNTKLGRFYSQNPKYFH